jgi:hypothetical protein
MWRALLSSGVLLAPLKAKIEAALRRAAVMAVAAVICLLFVLVGLFALAVAAIFALTPEFGLTVAAAIVGGAAILIGLIILLIGSLSVGGSRKPSHRQPSVQEATEKVGQMVKASPTAWLVGAALVGLILGRRM